MADPFCPEMRGILYNSASEIGARAHPSGTFVIINGPQFSTRAESHMYRSWGADIIGMTALPEAKLAREAEMCYSILACSTDYDCWHESAEPVTVEMVVENLTKNTAVSKAILADVITRLGPAQDCSCGSALENAIVTDRAVVTQALAAAGLEPETGWRYWWVSTWADVKGGKPMLTLQGLSSRSAWVGPLCLLVVAFLSACDGEPMPDPTATPTPDSTSTTVPMPTLVPNLEEARAELAAARDLWESKGSDDYTIEYIAFLYLSRVPMRLTVRNGVIESAKFLEGRDSGMPVPPRKHVPRSDHRWPVRQNRGSFVRPPSMEYGCGVRRGVGLSERVRCQLYRHSRRLLRGEHLLLQSISPRTERC